MNRQNNVPFNPQALSIGAASGGLYSQPQTGRLPDDFRESMIHIPARMAINSQPRTPDGFHQARPAQDRAGQSSAVRWRSSFKALDELSPQDGDSQDKSSQERLPDDFRESMMHNPAKMAINSQPRAPDMVPQTRPAQDRAVQSSAVRWRSSFKALDELSPQDGDSQDKSTSREERAELYDPFDTRLSDSDAEMSHGQNHNQDNNMGQQCLNSGRSHQKSHWDVPYSEPERRSFDRLDYCSETRAAVIRDLSPAHRLPVRQNYSPDTKSLDLLNQGSISRPLDHRSRSPDRPIRSLSTQQFPPSYGGKKTNGEEGRIIPEYRSKMATSVRMSPPRSQRKYQSEYVRPDLDSVTPSAELKRNTSKSTSKSITIDNISLWRSLSLGYLQGLKPLPAKKPEFAFIIQCRSSINCDLCDIELANGQELENHLESKTHWDTLEHIQQQNNYDDMTIAFLQEVMVYKSLKCSRAIDESALPALHENDHMTKFAVFNCAACQVFVTTSASSVQSHITSKEHLSKTKEFEARQRRSCLDKADTMMNEMKPQFEHFLKGGNPFE